MIRMILVSSMFQDEQKEKYKKLTTTTMATITLAPEFYYSVQPFLSEIQTQGTFII